MNNIGINRSWWAFPCPGIFSPYELNQIISRKLFSASDPTENIVWSIRGMNE
jgi:hypothetical protein